MLQYQKMQATNGFGNATFYMKRLKNGMVSLSSNNNQGNRKIGNGPSNAYGDASDEILEESSPRVNNSSKQKGINRLETKVSTDNESSISF